MCALDEWTRRRPRRAWCGARRRSPSCPTRCSASVLDLLAGRYPSEEFAELRPRLVWDRVEGIVRGRTGAQRLAVTNPGTIPDRGLFTVTLPDGTRVGELDEEMVYESRPGETFLLGASTWRIEDITFQKVIVTPGAGSAGEDAVLARRQAGPAPRARPRHRRLHPRAAHRRPRIRSPASATVGSTSAPPSTSSRTSTSRPTPRGWCPTTARSSSSGSRTRSATGGCACCRPSVPRCTPRGRWRCSTASASGGAWPSSSCGATTASSSGCPSRSTGCPRTSSSSIPTRSRS